MLLSAPLLPLLLSEGDNEEEGEKSSLPSMKEEEEKAAIVVPPPLPVAFASSLEAGKEKEAEAGGSALY